MPIYEYACAGCDSEFEKLVRVSAPTPNCPTCESTDQVRKLVSATSFILKGAGWYKDHYGLKPNKNGSDHDSSNGSGSNGKQEAGKTESASKSSDSSNSGASSSESTAAKSPPAAKPAASTTGS